MLVTTAGGDPLRSNILLTGPARAGTVAPLFFPAIDACLEGAPSISSMLLTGDRGAVVNGEDGRPVAAPTELADTLGGGAGVPSRRAITSLASWSRIASIDIGWCDMFAGVVGFLRVRGSWRLLSIGSGYVWPRRCLC